MGPATSCLTPPAPRVDDLGQAAVLVATLPWTFATAITGERLRHSIARVLVYEADEVPEAGKRTHREGTATEAKLEASVAVGIAVDGVPVEPADVAVNACAERPSAEALHTARRADAVAS